jgi:hypothetical protein
MPQHPLSVDAVHLASTDVNGAVTGQHTHRYTPPGLYAEEDFFDQQNGAVHKKCGSTNVYVRAGGADTLGWFWRMFGAVMPSTNGVVDPWKQCAYTHDVLDNGFDNHDGNYPSLKCQRTNNGTVMFVFLIGIVGILPLLLLLRVGRSVGSYCG